MPELPQVIQKKVKVMRCKDEIAWLKTLQGQPKPNNHYPAMENEGLPLRCLYMLVSGF